MSHTEFKDWPALGANLAPAIKELHKTSKGVMKGFREMSSNACDAGALDHKTKELLAVAISVSIRCDPCITYHIEAARRHGATREEIAETLDLAIYMGAGPSVMYAAQALEAYDQYVDKAAGA